MAIEQVDDFREEAQDLASLLGPISEGDWDLETTFKAWTINDVVQHLHFSDQMAFLSATDEDAYYEFRGALTAARENGGTMQSHTREMMGHIRGKQLLETWKDGMEKLCDALSSKGPETRFKWSGPDMGIRMFATARQMETWAHGQEIYDVLGKKRVNSDRLKNVAVIGVKTYGWTFANRKMEPPGEPPYVRLEAPSGDTWEWNETNTTDSVIGSAVDFCQVVTQVRNIADTKIETKGEAAKQWMAIAQCFAGPPENPPVPGSRVPSFA
ncbi:MAG: TIGR03084 family metal-binding protein [Pseudomonadota bacterium]